MNIGRIFVRITQKYVALCALFFKFGSKKGISPKICSNNLRFYKKKCNFFLRLASIIVVGIGT